MRPKKTRPESGLVSFDDIMNASHDLPPPNEPVRRKEDTSSTGNAIVATDCRFGSKSKEVIKG
jgi:hypothetical protein